MEIIRTVLGDVPASEMGRTLAHEHVLYAYPGAEWDHRTAFDLDEVADRVATVMKQGMERDNFRTLVEMTPVEVGRHPQLMAEASRRSGMNIIAITGFFPERVGLPFYWKRQTIEELTDFFVRDITEGMMFGWLQTGIKAGALKVATGQEGLNSRPSETNPSGRRVTPAEERLIRAAGRAQKQLGCGVNTHSDPTDYQVTNPGLEQIELLTEEGADPSKIAIGHVLVKPKSLDQAVEICNTGASINIDHIGIPWKYETREEIDEFMANEICELADKGFVENLILSYDRWFHNPRSQITELDPDMPNERVPFTYMFEHFVPRLLKKGFAEKDIDIMLVDNARRIFSMNVDG
jgi:phosphotriesterase-related protein